MKDRFAAYKSKRFVAVIIAMALFTVMVYTTEYSPIEIATAITIIFGMYIAMQTARQSPPDSGDKL